MAGGRLQWRDVNFNPGRGVTDIIQANDAMQRSFAGLGDTLIGLGDKRRELALQAKQDAAAQAQGEAYTSLLGQVGNQQGMQDLVRRGAGLDARHITSDIFKDFQAAHKNAIADELGFHQTERTQRHDNASDAAAYFQAASQEAFSRGDVQTGRAYNNKALQYLGQAGQENVEKFNASVDGSRDRFTTNFNAQETNRRANIELGWKGEKHRADMAAAQQKRVEAQQSKLMNEILATVDMAAVPLEQRPALARQLLDQAMPDAPASVKNSLFHSVMGTTPLGSAGTGGRGGSQRGGTGEDGYVPAAVSQTGNPDQYLQDVGIKANEPNFRGQSDQIRRETSTDDENAVFKRATERGGILSDVPLREIRQHFYHIRDNLDPNISPEEYVNMMASSMQGDLSFAQLAQYWNPMRGSSGTVRVDGGNRLNPFDTSTRINLDKLYQRAGENRVNRVDNIKNYHTRMNEQQKVLSDFSRANKNQREIDQLNQERILRGLPPLVQSEEELALINGLRTQAGAGELGNEYLYDTPNRLLEQAFQGEKAYMDEFGREWSPRSGQMVSGRERTREIELTNRENFDAAVARATESKQKLETLERAVERETANLEAARKKYEDTPYEPHLNMRAKHKSRMEWIESGLETRKKELEEARTKAERLIKEASELKKKL